MVSPVAKGVARGAKQLPRQTNPRGPPTRLSFVWKLFGRVPSGKLQNAHLVFTGRNVKRISYVIHRTCQCCTYGHERKILISAKFSLLSYTNYSERINIPNAVMDCPELWGQNTWRGNYVTSMKLKHPAPRRSRAESNWKLTQNIAQLSEHATLAGLFCFSFMPTCCVHGCTKRTRNNSVTFHR